MEEAVKKLNSLVNTHSKIVFLGGAGVSTESGIPDFRSADGLYKQKYKYPPETILSHTFFRHDPEEFYRFYREKMLFPNVKPNTTHTKLAEMEQKGRLSAVVTQNIDGLHQLAGSKKVFELHGSVLRNYCMDCGKFYTLQQIIDAKEKVPTCSCGGTIKPDVVLFEEPLDSEIMSESIKHISEADMLIVGGTSLQVYPAAGLIHYFSGDDLVLINRDATPYDSIASLVVHDSLGKIFGAITVE